MGRKQLGRYYQRQNEPTGTAATRNRRTESRDDASHFKPGIETAVRDAQGPLQRALWLAERCADDEATQILRARLTNLQAAALIVIVGEVKAGKSSFINALFVKTSAKSRRDRAPSAFRNWFMAAERKLSAWASSGERVSLPKEVLREITMVDTPGTNSIIQNHRDDHGELYSAKRSGCFCLFRGEPAHQVSLGAPFTLIRKEWHRKMVFVLQQADRASQRELTINREHVTQYARERQVENPIVFTLSAKREMEGITEQWILGISQLPPERHRLWRSMADESGRIVSNLRSVMTRLLTHLRREKSSDR